MHVKVLNPNLFWSIFIEIRFKSTWIFIVHYAIRHIFALYFKLTKNEGIPAKVKIIRNS